MSAAKTAHLTTQAEYACGFVEEKDKRLFLGELAYHNQELRFETNFDGAMPEYARNGKSTRPPIGLDTFVKTGCLRLPSSCSNAGNWIIRDIDTFLRRYVDMPDSWYEPIAHYIVMTWVFDKFSAVPYLRFLGESGTGKTRALEVCAALCYRAFLVNGNITGAALFRSIDLMQGTLLVDEADMRSSEAWSDIVKVFNNGYGVGSPVIRCDKDNGFVPVAFAVYGPKIIATRARFEDDALENRCLTFETSRRRVRPDIPLQLPPDSFFHQEATALRNRLLGWRFSRYSQINAGEQKLRHLNPRLAQIGSSLIAVAESDDARERLIKFLGQYGVTSQETNLVALVEQALTESFAGQKEFLVSAVANAVNVMLGFEVDASDKFIATGDEKIVTPKRVGGILRSLGYKTRHTKLGFLASPPEANR